MPLMLHPILQARYAFAGSLKKKAYGVYVKGKLNMLTYKVYVFITQTLGKNYKLEAFFIFSTGPRRHIATE